MTETMMTETTTTTTTKKNKFDDFAMKILFALLVGSCGLMTKTMIDIENRLRDLTTKVAELSVHSQRHEKDLEIIQGNMIIAMVRMRSEIHRPRSTTRKKKKK